MAGKGDDIQILLLQMRAIGPGKNVDDDIFLKLRFCHSSPIPFLLLHVASPLLIFLDALRAWEALLHLLQPSDSHTCLLWFCLFSVSQLRAPLVFRSLRIKYCAFSNINSRKVIALEL